MSNLAAIRKQIRALYHADEKSVLAGLVAEHGLDKASRGRISVRAAALIERVRKSGSGGLLEVFLAEYGLSTQEGVALMCLAEALLRVPDAQTVDELIEDKIAPSSWGEHLGQSSSSLVNASTWALMLTGKVLQEPASRGLADTLHSVVKRLGEPVIRAAVTRAMREMGHQFVLGRTISQATRRGEVEEEKGYTYSYDMLGEAALTAHDARQFFRAYSDAIAHLAGRARHRDMRKNPGISIKLSALHPRYEMSQKARVMEELVPRVAELARMAKTAHMGLNIDAEEADRLDLSLDVIEAVLRASDLAGWDGFGVVVQAYSKRAAAVIDWLYALATALDRTIMVRLVKGAYWDTEIKRAQVDGVASFPVFTNKAATDVSFICCAQKLLNYGDRITAQFATHNAHTVCAVLEMAKDSQSFEFQRLHGMGEALHALVLDEAQTRCRIYAPVGAHKDLLAYLVRRLLENGANSSFVNQIVDETVDAQTIAADPFNILDDTAWPRHEAVVPPPDLYCPQRRNAKGWDLRNPCDLKAFLSARDGFKAHQWTAESVLANTSRSADAAAPVKSPKPRAVFSPSDLDECIGYTNDATLAQVDVALDNATSWKDASAQQRARVLCKAADLYEQNAGEIFAALCREAGKTAADAVAELREAVDFLRYYAAEGCRFDKVPQRGVITCISPWNFPLAIFTGQIAAALAAGNGVLAKPAEPTPIVAAIAVRLMREAGVPGSVLQLVLGEGSVVGTRLTRDPRVNGICFTGSTQVAQQIYQSAAAALEPDFMFIAETGGLNAMIVDSTALPEQAVQDIMDSAFRSAGQRCSALRILYVQSDIADGLLSMLFGAMDELRVGSPWAVASDVGPIITPSAQREIADYVEQARTNGRLLKQLDAPAEGIYVAPAVISVRGIEDLEQEIFGPVLHVATFAVDEIDQVMGAINDKGYGLTFGLHTRIDDRVEHIVTGLNVGNIYVNRNQIGAVVGSQPFGGEGLSGTGPKAGGPHYVERFKRFALPGHDVVRGDDVALQKVQALLDAARLVSRAALTTTDMPGPTGESNRLSLYPRGVILCLGPRPRDVEAQRKMARDMGCAVVAVAPGMEGEDTVSGFLPRSGLADLKGFDAVALWSQPTDLKRARQALARREGPLIPLIATRQMADYCVLERHLCIDTTAAGGNASLLAAQ